MRSLLFIICFVTFMPLLATAQVAEPCMSTFQPIPFVQGCASTETYVNALYRLSIAAAALLVVLKLMGAGVKYMFSEVVTNKEAAKKDIMGAVLGMLIILAAVTILNTINPQLSELNFLRNATPVTPATGGKAPDPSLNNSRVLGGENGNQEVEWDTAA